MSYSFETKASKWDTLPDVFDKYLEELDAIESMDKEAQDAFDIPAFDVDEVL